MRAVLFTGKKYLTLWIVFVGLVSACGPKPQSTVAISSGSNQSAVNSPSNSGNNGTPPQISLTSLAAGTQNGQVSISKGQMINIRWKVSSDATSITLTPDTNLINFKSPVPLIGDCGANPETTTTYVLSATGPGGVSTADFTVNVQ